MNGIPGITKERMAEARLRDDPSDLRLSARMRRLFCPENPSWDILHASWADQVAVLESCLTASEKRLAEATRLLDAAGRMDGWKEQVERFLGGEDEAEI